MNKKAIAIIKEATMLRTELIETPYGSFNCFEQDYFVGLLKRNGAHQRNELAMILGMLREGDHVIDVGAHIGTFCIPIVTKIGKAGHVYAFEAFANNYELLTRNVAINMKEDEITPYLAMITDSPGQYKVVPSKSNSGAVYFTRGDDRVPINVDCVLLDEWWEQTFGRLGRGGKIELIKVDIEGMELEALKSCQNIISKYKPILFIEIRRSIMKRSGIHISALEAFLRPFGYHYFRLIGVNDSATDEFQMGRIGRLAHGGNSFNVVAICPESDRYPKKFWRVARTEFWIRYKKYETKLRYSQPYRTLKTSLDRLRKRPART